MAIQHFRKLVTTFYTKHSEKSMATSLLINSAPLITKPTIRPKASTKERRDQPAKANSTNKHTKKTLTSSFYLVFDPISIIGKRFPQSRDLLFCSLIFRFYQSLGFSSYASARRFFFYQLPRYFNFSLLVS